MRRSEASLVNEQTRRSSSVARALPLLVVLAASTAIAAPAISLFPAIGRPDAVTVTGRVYKEAPTHGSSTLSRNLRRLTASNWTGAPVSLRFEGVTTEVRSAKDGVFTATLRPAVGSTFAPGIGFIDVKVGKAASSRGAVEIVGDQAPFMVISDFDDTLAITNVLSARKLVANALLNDSKTQPVVVGMSPFYGCLRTEKAAAPGFALISGSPEQYASRIAGFLGHHRFPFFGMYLRNFSPSTMSGYKQPHIRRLLEQFPQKFVLVGDSGEKDPEIYAEMRAAFPDRIAAIYIRDAGRSENPKRFEGMVLFDDAREAAADAVKKGLMTSECFTRAFPEATASDAVH